MRYRDVAFGGENKIKHIMTKEQVRHHLARLEMMMAEENKKFDLSYEKALGIVDKQLQKNLEKQNKVRIFTT